MGAKHKWYGKSVLRATRSQARAAVEAAIAQAYYKVLDQISTPAPVIQSGSRRPRRGTLPMVHAHSAAGKPPFSVTGKLRKSFKRKVRYVGNSVVGTLRTDNPIGTFMEMGTAPHPIAGMPWLIFPWRNSGKSPIPWIGKTQVEHPGTKPRLFFYSTLKDNQAQIHRVLVGTIQALGGAIG